MSRVHEALCPEDYTTDEHNEYAEDIDLQAFAQGRESSNDYDSEINCYIDTQIKENKLEVKFKELNSLKPLPGEPLHKYIMRTNWPHRIRVYTEGQNDDKPKTKPKRNVYKYGKSSNTANT
jgi:hypothetical protein